MYSAKIVFIVSFLLLANGTIRTTNAGVRDYLPSLRSLNPFYWLSTNSTTTNSTSIATGLLIDRSDNFVSLNISASKSINKTEVTEKPKIILTPNKSTNQDRTTTLNSNSLTQEPPNTPQPSIGPKVNHTNYAELIKQFEGSKKKFPKVKIKSPLYQNKSLSSQHVEAFDAEDHDKVVKDWKKILSTKPKPSTNSTNQ